MRGEAPDTHFYAEIRDLNLEFLGLVAAGGRQWHGPVFGLDSAVADQIGRLNPAQLEAMAATPCLLAGFTAGRVLRAGRVGEPPPAVDPEWAADVRLFAAGLFTYVLQAARRDSLRAALCAGSAAGLVAGDAVFRDLRGCADRAVRHLEARFRRQARFWPDLVRATRDGNPQRLQLARLSAIQLATFEAGRHRSAPAGATPSPGLAAGTTGTR